VIVVALLPRTLQSLPIELLGEPEQTLYLATPCIYPCAASPVSISL
jgi:hypothetical protein